MPCPRNDADVLVGRNIVDDERGFKAQLVIGGGKSQQLGEHFIGGDDGFWTKSAAEFQNLVMKAVAGICEGNPVKCVGENRLHRSFLGRP